MSDKKSIYWQLQSKSINVSVAWAVKTLYQLGSCKVGKWVSKCQGSEVGDYSRYAVKVVGTEATGMMH